MTPTLLVERHLIWTRCLAAGQVSRLSLSRCSRTQQLCSVFTGLTHTCFSFTHTCCISGDRWQVGLLSLPEKHPQWRKAGSTHKEKWRYLFQSLTREFISRYFKDADDGILKRYQDLVGNSHNFKVLNEYDSHVGGLRRWTAHFGAKLSSTKTRQSVFIQTLRIFVLSGQKYYFWENCPLLYEVVSLCVQIEAYIGKESSRCYWPPLSFGAAHLWEKMHSQIFWPPGGSVTGCECKTDILSPCKVNMANS